MILLNPGPVNLSVGVRNALMQPDLCHRESEFSDLQDAVRRDLLAVYTLPPEAWAAVLFAGSGTAAVEAMLASLITKNGKVLVIENGVYGERMSQIVKAYGIRSDRLTYEWGQRIDVRDIEKNLEADPDITDLAIVHHETTTGRLNDLAAVAGICRSRDVHMHVDAVSSFGAEQLDFEEWGVTACAGTANKCLHGAPGLSFVIARRDVLGRANTPRRTFYLDLARHCHQQDNRGTAFTQPVHLFYALSQALKELRDDGGWRSRHNHYRDLAYRVRTDLIALGITPMLTEDETSVVLSSYYLPDKMTYEHVHSRLKKHGFVIYAGQGQFSKRIFRISTMGAIDTDHIKALLSACHHVFSGDAALATTHLS